MIIRSKAPLRIGLAGGGTDVSPYSDVYGGAILNATISLYAHAHLDAMVTREINLHAAARQGDVRLPLQEHLEIAGKLDLARGIYNRMVRDYGPVLSGFRLTTHVDAPAGSGLGTCSSLVVAILGA